MLLDQRLGGRASKLGDGELKVSVEFFYCCGTSTQQEQPPDSDTYDAHPRVRSVRARDRGERQRRGKAARQAWTSTLPTSLEARTSRSTGGRRIRRG